MPPRPTLRMRTWGTRFDTLPTSPEISPQSPEISLQVDAHTAQTEHRILTSTLKRKEERMPHDASVFVGSLPSNVDQQELTRLLSEHLSEHTEVKNIKVVRDSKGGVCAFVQCEDAASAASLIHTLHSNPPKYFLGRTLRYEPARAFRTLLISYRTPVQHIPVKIAEGSLYTGDEQIKSQVKELPLPSAMRVARPGNAKFYSICYNGEAVDAENRCDDSGVIFDKPSLFLCPLAFDAETIRTMAAFFGELETFDPLQSRKPATESEFESTGEGCNFYPAPHNASRCPEMDAGCWEVKWKHRDDCINALMTLRRVPHLTVTWAHQPHFLGFEQRPPYSPFFQSNVANHPLHKQSARFRAPSSTDSLDLSRKSVDVSSDTSQFNTASIGAVADSELENRDDAIAFTPTSPNRSPVPPVRWSDMDFPPLGDVSGSYKTESGIKNQKKEPNRRARSTSLTIPQQSKRMEYPFNDAQTDLNSKDHGQELEMPATPGLGRSPLTPKTPGSAFPITPTTANNSVQSLPFNESGGKEDTCPGELSNSERSIDPTTLFVGGLETFGPGAWDEEKVFKFFARFGGLESVKIVRPLNSQAAFAFVKYNNTESPARAVYEEHNRVYNGRAMRVQLRECNPPRGSWKYSRGRSRFNQPQYGHRRHHIQPGKLSEAPDSQGHDPQVQDHRGLGTAAPHENPSNEAETVEEQEPPVYTETATTQAVEAPNDTAVAADSSGEPDASSPRTSFTSAAAPASEGYREWYGEQPPTVADVPLPATTTPTTSTPLQYPTAGSYFTPAPWAHPYGPIPYSVPYIGYPGYPLNQSQIPASFSRRPGTEVNVGTPNPGGWHSIGMYGSYIPYQPPPARSSALEGAPSQQVSNKAPLAPTGFIQNEQGALIAVYQPEALDQYMAGAHSPAVPQHPVTNVQGWPQYPQPPVYPFPGPPPATVTPSRPSVPSANIAWVQSQAFRQAQQHAAPHTPQVPHASATMHRGGFGDAGGPNASPSFRRQQGRREQNYPQHSHGRNTQFRSFPNRSGRGNMNNLGRGAHSDNTRSTPNLALNPIEWNQRGNIPGR